MCVCVCEGDFTGDCLVNFDDLKMLADAWLSDYDFSDFAEMAANWLKCNDMSNSQCQ